MKELAERMAAFLVRNGANAKMEQAYSYGIECGLSTSLILALLIVAGFLLQKPAAMLVYIIAWLPLRMLVGGAHANAHWSCTIMSVLLGTTSVLLSGIISQLPLYIVIPAILFCFVVFFLTAPIVHKNHPISTARRKKARLAACILAAVEGTVVGLLAFRFSPMLVPAFMGYFITAALAVLGYFGKNTLKNHAIKRKAGKNGMGASVQ